MMIMACGVPRLFVIIGTVHYYSTKYCEVVLCYYINYPNFVAKQCLRLLSKTPFFSSCPDILSWDNLKDKIRQVLTTHTLMMVNASKLRS